MHVVDLEGNHENNFQPYNETLTEYVRHEESLIDENDEIAASFMVALGRTREPAPSPRNSTLKSRVKSFATSGEKVK